MTTIRFSDDNPAHVLACCGVFELAGRLAPAPVRSRFVDDLFEVEGFDLPTLQEVLTSMEIEAINPEYKGVSPILLKVGGLKIRLDWWSLPGQIFDGKPVNSNFKTWAARQNIVDKVRDLLKEIREVRSGLMRENLLDLSLFKAAGRIGIDPRSSCDALDLGMSLNDIAMEREVFPVTELLAVIGLQRFRPISVENRTFQYSLWESPLPVLSAAHVFRHGSSRVFQFSTAMTRGDYFKDFTFTTRV